MSKASKSRQDPKQDTKPEARHETKQDVKHDTRPERARRAAARGNGDEWSEVANFVITFERRGSEDAGTLERRISAHKMQDGGISARWSGVAQQPMVAWMAEHVGDWVGDEAFAGEVAPASAAAAGPNGPSEANGPNGPNGPATRAAPAVANALAIAIQDFRVHAQGGAAAFDLEASIEVEGFGGAGAARLPPCSVSFYSRNVANHDKSTLGTVVVDDLVPGRKSYRALLPEVKLPAGEYRLESVALLEGPAAKVAYKSGPVLHVR